MHEGMEQGRRLKYPFPSGKTWLGELSGGINVLIVKLSLSESPLEVPAEPSGQAEGKVDGRVALKFKHDWPLTSYSHHILPYWQKPVFVSVTTLPQIRHVLRGSLAHPLSREAGPDSSKPTTMVPLSMTDLHKGVSMSYNSRQWGGSIDREMFSCF